MKKNYYLALIIYLLLTTNSNAQLNYSFSATTSTYQPVVFGTTPTLVNRPFGTNQYSFTYDEGFANSIPIGFTFNYNGVDYTTINMNANGFATLGDPLITDSTFKENYYANDMTHGNTFGQIIGQNSGVPHRKSKPILAPLWDDLDLQANSNFRYIVTGFAGSRVFTIEWAHTLWQYDATPSTLSFELKFYEGTNVIEFCYSDEGGFPSAGASASIGITDNYNNGTLLSLQDASSNPVVSNVENNAISQKPANNQVYRFTPSQYPAPLALQYSGYTNNNVTFKWSAAKGATGYEYAVTNSPTLPSSGTATTLSNATALSLNSDAEYYIHVRSSFAGNNFSQWSSVYFKTANDPVTLPYNDGFETASVPALPENTRAQIIESLNYQPGEDYGPSYLDPIAIYNDGYAATGSNYLQLNANLDTVPTFFYLPGINLVAGLQYKLRFNFQAGFYFPIGGADTGLNHLDMLTVTSGNAVGSDSATSVILDLPWRTINFSSAASNGYIDTSVTFSPSSSGIYYIGFKFNSGVQKDTHTQLDFAYAALDDISLTTSVLPVTLINFSGEAQGKRNLLHWTTTTEIDNTGYEIQRSNDGNNFSKIDFVQTKSLNGNSNLKLNYEYPDYHFTNSTSYYRLKQIDKDGNHSLSNIVVIKNNIGDLTPIATIYPSPAKSVLNVKLIAQLNTFVTLQITDGNGKLLQNRVTNIGNGETIVQLNVSQLKPGAYFIKTVSPDGKENMVKKFVKE